MTSAEPEHRPRVLVVRLSALGDCLHALPVAVELRRQLPGAHIGWAIEALGHQILRDHPAVDRFHLYPRRSPPLRFARDLLALRRELHEERYDIALDLQGLTKSGLVAWLSGAPRRVSLGPPDRRELNRLFVSEAVTAPAFVRHVVDRNLSLLRAVGLKVPERARFELPVLEPSTALAALLDSLPAARLAVVNPGASWNTKIWSTTGYAQVARGLADRHGLGVVVAWGNENEHALAREVVRAAERPQVVEAPATSLRDLAALLSRARVVVSGDTGPMHLAVALGVPVVSVFGPTAPERNGPYGERDLAVTAGIALECQPCWRRTCSRGDHACLARLDADRVLAACSRRLADEGSALLP